MAQPLCDCNPPRPCTRHQAKTSGRLYWCCDGRVCQKFIWDDIKGTQLSLPGEKCRCGVPSVLKTSRKPHSAGRQFWTCASTGSSGCNFFKWKDEEWTPPAGAAPATPPPKANGDRACVQCRKPVQVAIVSAGNTKGNAGRRYYKCQACGKFEFVDPGPALPPLTPEATVGSVEHVVDEPTRRVLQRVFEVPPAVGLAAGADLRQSLAGYDHLKVECAWRVTNPQRRARYQSFVQRLQSAADEKVSAPLVLREEYRQAVEQLPDETDSLANEVLLLHGTRPEALHSILFEGLDPALARSGLFGRGTYFAEHAAKVDQYMTVDREWQGPDPSHALHPLHRKLYERGVKHAGEVYYALVCRVAMGSPLVTKDGHRTHPQGTPLFKDESRTALTNDRHSLVADVGGAVSRFREFVVFDSSAIDILYLVALKRERYYCDCGEPALHRTVKNGQPQNYGRSILLCPSETGGCGFFQMLPLCHCGMSAGVAESQRGTRYYRCGRLRKPFCTFKDWNGPPGHPNTSGASSSSAWSSPSANKRPYPFSSPSSSTPTKRALQEDISIEDLF